MNKPTATVREIDGTLVLDDPDALAVGRVVAKHNCRMLLEANSERIAHFVRRTAELGRDAASTVIVILNVDDSLGALLAGALMPGHDWQAYRDRGEIPIARGLAVRAGIQQALDDLDDAAAEKLRAATELSVVVVDNGVAEVFEAANA